MRIINRSDWKTSSLQKALKAGGITRRGLVIQFLSKKNGVRAQFVSGKFKDAIVTLPAKESFVLKKLGSDTPEMVRITYADIIRVLWGYTTRGVFNNWPELEQTDLELKKYRPSNKPKSGTAEHKLWQAQQGLKRAERRCKLAETIRKKWQKKVNRLEKRIKL